MDRRKLHDTIESECASLRGVARGLDRLSKAFLMTGNSQVAEELADSAESLFASAFNLQEADRGESRAAFDASVNQVGSILSALVNRQSQ